MCRNPLPLVINFKKGIREPKIHFLSDILIRAGIAVLLIYHMEIDVYAPAILPPGDLIGKCRKRPQIRFFFLVPDLITAVITLLEVCSVESVQFLTDGGF